MSEPIPFAERRRSIALKNFSGTRTLLVAADGVYCQYLIRVLNGIGISDVAASDSFQEALIIIKSQSFDLILVDKEVDDSDGLLLGPVIRRIQPECTTILMAEQSRWAITEAARELGFNSIIRKGAEPSRISRSIQESISHRPPRHINDAHSSHSKVSLLSHREREILIDISTGKQNQEIARARHISESTIKSHLSSIYRKLGVRNRVEAIAQIRS